MTVAVVVENEGQFLIIEEEVGGKRVYNQPAGHLEAGESLAEAVVRETWEETGLRFTFCAGCLEHNPDKIPDTVYVTFYGWIKPT